MRPFFRSGQASPQDRTRGTDMASVSIAKPSEVGLADWMSHLRDWLNRHGIEPAGFKYHDRGLGNRTHEMSFPDQGQADLFAAKFNKASSITNTNPGPPGRDPFQFGQGSSSEPKSIIGWLHATGGGQQ
jgi:hypothetical protein